jgi:hypothetical protein
MAQAMYSHRSTDASLNPIDGYPLQEQNVLAASASGVVILPEHGRRLLFEHYATHVAPLMVWLDSDENEYRRLILPLAEHHVVLQLAISAISAAQIPAEPDYGIQFSQRAYEAAIVLITEEVRKMNSSDETQDSGKSVEENSLHVEGVLAAILILTFQSLLEYQLSHVQFHRHATRVLMDRLPATRLQNDELCLFLKNQASYFDIMVCTTLFNPENVQNSISPEFGRSDNMFAHYLSVVHRITALSLQHQNPKVQYDEAFLDDIERDFALAQGRDLLTAGKLINLRTDLFKEDFIRLMQVWHHAGIVYACKRLELKATRIERHNSLRLLAMLKQFGDIDKWIQDLAWPTFIAGIGACNDNESKSFIINLCEKMSTNTGYRHYCTIPTFLRELWQTPHGDWILLAKERETNGQPIMAF